MIKQTQGTNSPMGGEVDLGTHIGDKVAIVTFATACGIPVEAVTKWVEDGTLPSITFAGQRLVNVQRIRSDLLEGKADFEEGGYSHE